MGHELAVRCRRGRAEAFRRGRPGTPAGGAPATAQSLDEVVGQEHLLGEGSALRVAIEQGRPHSMILYGPPGSGKTTLARIVAAAPTPPSRSSARSRPAAPRCARCSSAPSTAASWPSRRSSSSTRSTASTRPSRTRCCPRSRRASSRSSARRRRTRTSRSTPRCSRAAQVYELRPLLGRATSRSLLRRAVERGSAREADDDAIALPGRARRRRRAHGARRARARGAHRTADVTLEAAPRTRCSAAR